MKKTLKQHRKHAGVSVKEVAAHMCVSIRTVYSWEDGTRPISAVSMFNLLMLYKADAKFSELPILIPIPHTELVPAGAERGDETP